MTRGASTGPPSGPPGRPPAGEKERPPGEPADHARGRSRGGYGTEVHRVCDRTMLPLGFVLTPGQQHEATAVPDPVRSIPRPGLRFPAKVAGDRGYSSPAVRAFLAACGAEPVIPHRRDELARMPEPPRFDRRAYRQRNAVERLVGRLKEWRRIGTRFETLAVNFAAMIRLAFIRLDLAR